jgi:ABC-type dipeptide/oligopeptide/nickel transport system ATPase subunit
MNLRVKSLRIKNFKAFQDLDVNLAGRHLLAYGLNGSGKSSLYWALYTHLQSAGKSSEQVQKYFDRDHGENLLNLFAPENAAGEITLMLQNRDGSVTHSYTISRDHHGTANIPDILKANLASDFINYRVLFNFYHFTNSQTVDLWPVFEREILPFCRSSLHPDIYGLWSEITAKNPYEEVQRRRLRGYQAAFLYDSFEEKIVLFDKALEEILGSISKEAQRFYDKRFRENDEPELKLELKLVGILDYDRKKHQIILPKIGLAIRLGGTPIHKPQTFLNEGKLTQIALSIRFAATLTQLHDAPLKLLVLDDLLISLDMSNRMKVVEIILGDEFADYQKIILTHKLGFFQEFRRNLGPDHAGWCFKRFTGTPRAGIGLRQEKNDLERAEDHLQNHDLEEAALSLRKAVEELASHYRERLDEKKLPQGFHPLAENLRAAKNKLLAQLPLQLYQKVLHELPGEQRFFLLPSEHTDIDANPDLTAAQKGILKAQRKRLKTLIEAEHWQAMESINLLEKLLGMTSRVLNPAAHAGAEPIYEHEVRKAQRLIEKLESKLKLCP